MSAALERLRNETRALHEAVESTATMRAATGRLGDATAHGDYLAALAVAVRPLIHALLDHPGNATPDLLPDRDTWRRLDEDLAALGRPPSASSPLPVRVADDDGAWGRLYVVRGAEAGITLLARQIAKLDAARTLPTTFLSDVAKRRGDWPTLCAALGRLGPDEAQRAADVARGDFDYVLAAISSWESERMTTTVA